MYIEGCGSRRCSSADASAYDALVKVHCLGLCSLIIPSVLQLECEIVGGVGMVRFNRKHGTVKLLCRLIVAHVDEHRSEVGHAVRPGRLKLQALSERIMGLL